MTKILTTRRKVILGGSALLASLATPVQAKRLDIKSLKPIFKNLFGNRPFEPGRIILDVPLIAEDGSRVIITIKVDSPMTNKDYVKALHFFAEENPNPRVASYNFNPGFAAPEVTFQFRLAKSQWVTGVAEMSDGSLHMERKRIKVTIGGCGGAN